MEKVVFFFRITWFWNKSGKTILRFQKDDPPSLPYNQYTDKKNTMTFYGSSFMHEALNIKCPKIELEIDIM